MNIARRLVRLAKSAPEICACGDDGHVAREQLRQRIEIAGLGCRANAEMSCACFASISPGHAGKAALDLLAPKRE
jgi:hypothetical protein